MNNDYLKLILYILLMMTLFLFIACDENSTLDCGTTSYTEQEAVGTNTNNACQYGNVSSVCDNAGAANGQPPESTGFTFKRGCTYTITGYIEAGGTAYDYYKVNLGNTTGIQWYVTWSGGTDALDAFMVDNKDGDIENGKYYAKINLDYNTDEARYPMINGYERFFYQLETVGALDRFFIIGSDPGKTTVPAGGVNYTVTFTIY